MKQLSPGRLPNPLPVTVKIVPRPPVRGLMFVMTGRGKLGCVTQTLKLLPGLIVPPGTLSVIRPAPPGRTVTTQFTCLTGLAAAPQVQPPGRVSPVAPMPSKFCV